MARRGANPTPSIALLADQIRGAYHYLTAERRTKVAELCKALKLHKNSVLRAGELHFTWAVKRERKPMEKRPRKPDSKNKYVLIAANEGDRGVDGKLATMEWLWNPQLDTFEKLEKLVPLAMKEGYTGDVSQSLRVAEALQKTDARRAQQVQEPAARGRVSSKASAKSRPIPKKQAKKQAGNGAAKPGRVTKAKSVAGRRRHDGAASPPA